jgi:hypothetical protein
VVDDIHPLAADLLRHLGVAPGGGRSGASGLGGRDDLVSPPAHRFVADRFAAERRQLCVLDRDARKPCLVRVVDLLRAFGDRCAWKPCHSIGAVAFGGSVDVAFAAATQAASTADTPSAARQVKGVADNRQKPNVRTAVIRWRMTIPPYGAIPEARPTLRPDQISVKNWVLALSGSPNKGRQSASRVGFICPRGSLVPPRGCATPHSTIATNQLVEARLFRRVRTCLETEAQPKNVVLPLAQ